MSNQVQFINLSTYTSPKVVEIRNQDWISYGEDNDYYSYLQDRINGSPTNNAIINGISQMIFGKGLNSLDKIIDPEGFSQAMLLFDNDTIEKLCYDLKAMGQCAIQCIYSIDRSRILKTNHFPIETLRSGKCNENGEVEFYYYAEDWKKINRNIPPKAIPAFGTSKSGEEILFIKPYKTGFYYYSPTDYTGCLQYCETEEEISNFHLNNIINGLAPSMLLNFSNGIPTETEQREIENAIKRKFSGTSNAGKFILNFSDGKENAATITPVQLSEAHLQYEFLSNECMRKIMVGHRIISPMLLGIKDNSGLGNNADELQTATILMENTVIRPFQNLIIKYLNKILNFNEINVKLYFKTLQPLDSNNQLTVSEDSTIIIDKINGLTKELATKVLANMTQDEIRALVGLQPTTQPIGVQMSIDLLDFSNDEDLSEYELIDSRNVDYDKENDLDNLISVNLASTGTAYGNAKSNEDSPIYKVRYRYGGNASPERKFCKQMMSANKIYRKEDITRMSAMTVNPGFGMKPDPMAPYDIFLWKGGGLLSDDFPFGTCKHFWIRETYARQDRKNKVDVYSPNSEIVSPTKSIKENGFIPKVNDSRAYIAPHDM